MIKKHPAISTLGSMAIAIFLKINFGAYGGALGIILVGAVMLAIAINDN